MRRIATLAVALPLMAGAYTFTESPAKAESAKMETKAAAEQQVMTVRASKVIGMNVYTSAAKEVGDIKDVVLDGNTRKVSYAVVSYGGIMGIGDKLFAVPWQALQHRGTEPDKLFINLTEEQMKAAPGFDEKNWPNMADENLRKQIDKHYGVDDAAHDAAGKAGAAMDKAGDKMADVARNAGDAVKGGDREITEKTTVTKETMKGDTNLTKDGLLWTRKISQIMGADVTNEKDENLGDVEDLVLDAKSGKVMYAVLSFGGVLGIGDKLFAIPMDSLMTKADDMKLVLNVDKQMLKDAPGFNKEKWPDFADAKFRGGVDEYYMKNGKLKQD